jgi:hypothetical protein
VASSRHWKVTPETGLEKPKVAVVAVVGVSGPEVIVGAGSGVIVHVRTAAALGPEVVRARTRKVCVPSARPVYVFGLAQLEKAAPSSRHSNVAPLTTLVNENEAARSSVVDGGADVIAGGGGGWIVHAYTRAALVPVELRARTLNVRLPLGSEEYVFGLAHASQTGATSMRHWYEVAPALEKRKVALAWYEGSGGADVIVGVGGASAALPAAGRAPVVGRTEP